jgi:hypothetical protein
MDRSIPLNVALAVGLAACAAHGPAPPARAARPAAPGEAAAPLAPPEPFRGRVRPVLAQRCAPCHEPGGRMYERLPFDDPQIVRDHREGVLRRLKGDERAIVEAWLEGS